MCLLWLIIKLWLMGKKKNTLGFNVVLFYGKKYHISSHKIVLRYIIEIVLQFLRSFKDYGQEANWGAVSVFYGIKDMSSSSFISQLISKFWKVESN